MKREEVWAVFKRTGKIKYYLKYKLMAREEE